MLPGVPVNFFISHSCTYRGQGQEKAFKTSISESEIPPGDIRAHYFTVIIEHLLAFLSGVVVPKFCATFLENFLHLCRVLMEFQRITWQRLNRFDAIVLGDIETVIVTSEFLAIKI